ncbi:hypothetical protein Enr13x_29810 [Stieleria neptunia]|uniref:Lysylphosphatidylglycerol synthase TM region n=1 Tax=Stieleria neptunia TaxID=2527979 RepID=A0A518HQP4_9BACT|nr:hypothetical protein [Stieleria neptunia]QDV43127.1 hypothetical protein Enr13x_29810 [Stieleria neptunia]
MSSNVKRVARGLIAAVVIVGLVLAARSAITQWNHQKKLALERIAEIETAIGSAKTGAQRRQLESDLASARSQVPEVLNLAWGKIGLAAVFYGLGLIPGGVVLYEGTRVLGYRVRIQDVLSAQVVGHLGKYVPGKAMVVVIRAGRLRGVGVPVVAGSIAVFLETLTMMAVGAAVAGGLIFLLPVPRWIAWCALCGGVLATLPTLPPVLKRLVNKVAPKPQTPPDLPLPPGTGPESPGTDPGSTGTDPGSTGTDPGSMGTDPGSTGTDPGLMGTDPGLMGTDPGLMGTDPGLMGTDPGLMGTDPGLMGTDPGLMGTDPGLMGTDSGLMGTDPGLMGVGAGSGGAESVVVAVGHDWRFFVSAWIGQGIAWALIGASFAWLVDSIPGERTVHSALLLYAASVASIALAMVVGFASLLPGGAGVRELTLAVVLAPVIGGSHALLAAILARLLFIGVELLAVAAVALLGRLGERKLGHE